ncbi:hypothetical protein T4A_10143 [Trichinella pseudospiralis]|uniref:Uncharacterized protein n=1 Tax=Trichinella pseudospiralis TaxID=6337 RepID=A0A0V1KGC9_TRIPS|nr:hypothetical protein T4A_10143 [Trichinella pseudospiralis]KRZ46225.1 hypothetical protein T4C_9765 [Trichinella pseudospiralis]
MKVVDSTTATATVCFFLDEILFLDTPVFQAPCIIVVVSICYENTIKIMYTIYQYNIPLYEMTIFSWSD